MADGDKKKEGRASITGRSQHIPLWTDIDPYHYDSKTQEPVQKYKFIVDLLLWKGTITKDGRISNPRSWRPAQHLIKAIDLPSMELGGFENKSGGMNSSDSVSMQATDAAISDLTVTFYLTRALALSLRQTYFTYYATFASTPPTGLSEPVIFETGARGTLTVNSYMRSNSRIIVTLVSSTTKRRHYDPLVARERDEFGSESPPEVETDTTEITYYNITPISLDLGELAYGDSEIVEAKMVFNVGSLGIGEATPLTVAKGGVVVKKKKSDAGEGIPPVVVKSDGTAPP
jgi:hypothetical protein